MWCCWFSTLVQQALNNSVVPLLLMNNVLSLEFEPVKTCIASLNFLPGTTPAVILTDKCLMGLGYKFVLPVLQYSHTLMHNTSLPLLKCSHDTFGVFHILRWLLAWLPEIAQESQNLLLCPLPTNSWAPWLFFLPVLSNQGNVFTTQATTAQVNHSWMATVSSEPNILHMMLGLVFTMYIPVQL